VIAELDLDQVAVAGVDAGEAAEAREPPLALRPEEPVQAKDEGRAAGAQAGERGERLRAADRRRLDRGADRPGDPGRRDPPPHGRPGLGRNPGRRRVPEAGGRRSAGSAGRRREGEEAGPRGAAGDGRVDPALSRQLGHRGLRGQVT